MEGDRANSRTPHRAERTWLTVAPPSAGNGEHLLSGVARLPSPSDTQGLIAFPIVAVPIVPVVTLPPGLCRTTFQWQ